MKVAKCLIALNYGTVGNHSIWVCGANLMVSTATRLCVGGVAMVTIVQGEPVVPHRIQLCIQGTQVLSDFIVRSKRGAKQFCKVTKLVSIVLVSVNDCIGKYTLANFLTSQHCLTPFLRHKNMRIFCDLGVLFYFWNGLEHPHPSIFMNPMNI